MALSASISVARSSPRLGGHEVVTSENVSVAALQEAIRTDDLEAGCRVVAENIKYSERERIGAARDGADAHFVTQATKINGKWHALVARDGGFVVGPELSELYRGMDPQLVQHYMESYERAWSNQGLEIRVNSAETFSSNRTYIEVPQKILSHGFEMVRVTHIEIPLAQNGESASVQVRSLVTNLFGPQAIDPSSPTGYRVPPRSEWPLEDLHRGIVHHLMERDASVASEYMRRSESFIKDPALHQRILQAEIAQLTRELSRDPSIRQAFDQAKDTKELKSLAEVLQQAVIRHLSESGISVSTKPVEITAELTAAFQNREFEKLQTATHFRFNPKDFDLFTPTYNNSSHVQREILAQYRSSPADCNVSSAGTFPSSQEPRPVLSHFESQLMSSGRLERSLSAYAGYGDGPAPSLNPAQPGSSINYASFTQLSFPPLPRLTASSFADLDAIPLRPQFPVINSTLHPPTTLPAVSERTSVREKNGLPSFRAPVDREAAHSPKLSLRLNRTRPDTLGQKVHLNRISEVSSRTKSRPPGNLATAKSLGLPPSSSTHYSIRASIRLSFDGILQARKTLTRLIRGAVSAANTASQIHPRGIGSIATAIRSTPLHSVRLSVTAPLPRDLRRGISQLIKQLSERGLQALESVRLAVRRSSPPLAISNRRVVARGEPARTRQSGVSNHRTIPNHRRLARSLREGETIARHRSENRALPRAICSPQRAALNLLRQLERSLALKRSHLTEKTQVQSKAVSKSDLAVVTRLIDRNIARTLKRLALLRESLSPLQTRQLRAMLRISKARLATLDVAALLSLNETLDEFLHRPIRRTRNTRERPQRLMKRGRSGLERGLSDAPGSPDYADIELESTPIPTLENGLSGSSLPRPLNRPRTQYSRKAGSHPSTFPQPAASSANAILPEEAPSNELTTQRIRLRDSRNVPDQLDDSSVDSTAPSPYSLSL